jgi:hypothetical protein
MNTSDTDTGLYDCAAAQRQIGAEPRALPAKLQQHLATCAACQQFRADTLRLEQAIHAALELVPPLAAPAPANKIRELPVRRPRVAPRYWALAASVVLAVAVGAFLWVARPDTALAGELVAHMGEELASWESQDAVPQSALAFVVRRSGVALAPEARVTYAHSCLFRGQFVPHLVVQSSVGPVTVMILPGESVRQRQPFSEGGYSGVIEPGVGGAFAILARGDVDVTAAIPEVARAIVWR